MKIQFRKSKIAGASFLIVLMTSCIGQPQAMSVPSLESTYTVFPSSKITPISTAFPISSVTSTISPTPDVCNPAHWQEDGIYVLSTDQFGALRPGGPNTFNRILIDLNPAWADFRQEDHDELRFAGVLFHERSFGPTIGTGVNPAVVLVTYGVEWSWELPENGNLVSRVEQIRDSLYQHEVEWDFGEVDRFPYPQLANGATYALFRFFEGNQESLETWCRTYVDVYGESPLMPFEQ